jgi:hypothetical protein
MVAAATTSHLKPKRFNYIGLSLLCALIVFAGFWPSYFKSAVVGAADHPAIIHIHATVYVGWLLLFIAQAWFAGTGRIAVHMKIGNCAVYYGVLVILTGLMVTFGTFYLDVRSDEITQSQTAFLSSGPLLDMLVFAPFFGAAIYFRKISELHKRLMIVAATSLLIAAVGRMWFWDTPRNLWLEYGIWTSPILVAMAYNFARSRLVHPVYVTGLVVIALESRVVRRAIHETESWNAFNCWLAGMISG